MTDQQINAAIAEACGWIPRRRSWKLSKGENGSAIDYFETKEAAEEYLQICRRNTADWLNEVDVFEVAAKPPNYCTDLNAMHEVEKVLTELQCGFFRTFLREKLTNEPASRYIWHATARQRAEAFLRALGKWEEGK